MDIDNLGHRKFLKSAVNGYEIGGYIPDAIFQKSGEISLKWLKQTSYGSAIYFFSRNCAACDIEVAHETCKKLKDFSYAIFCEGFDSDAITQLQNRYTSDNVKVYAYESKYIREQLNIRAVPYMLVLNKIGQVIGANVVNTYIHSQELLQPLIRSIKR